MTVQTWVACGRDGRADQLARDPGCAVVGVDLSQESVEATRLTAEAGVGDRARFVHGGAERLPLAGESADCVLRECALCTFPGGRRRRGRSPAC